MTTLQGCNKHKPVKNVYDLTYLELWRASQKMTSTLILLEIEKLLRAETISLNCLRSLFSMNAPLTYDSIMSNSRL